jgi:hypothetical protein
LDNPTPTPIYTGTPIPTTTPQPSAAPTPEPTLITTTLACSDIAGALKEGDPARSAFLVSSIGAPIQFSGYVFQLDTEKNLISIRSDDCSLEIWLKGIPHSTVIYTSYTQWVTGSGTVEGYPDEVYMDEMIVNIDLGTLWIQ